jgi:hypothetical protein
MDETCPKCQAVNDPGATACSKCGLDLTLFNFIMACLTGNIPTVASPTILESGEVAYFASPVTMLAQKTDVSVKRNFIGTRVNFSGMPIYLGRSTPHKESSEVLIDAGSGEFVLSNQRVIVTSDKGSFDIPLSKIMNFEHYGSGIQIFNEGRHGGIIYQVNDSWRLWILLFTMLKAKGGLNPSNEAEAQELRHFALHVCEEVKGVQTASNRQEWIETLFHNDISTCLWSVIVPPVGLYLVWKSDFSWFHKVVWILIGLYCLGRWSMFFQGIG